MRKRSAVAAKKVERDVVEAEPESPEASQEVEERKKKVEETSRALEAELEDVQFEVARPPRATPLDPGFAKIVESQYVDDPFDLYAQLEHKLRVQDKRPDHGSLMDALNEAETCARQAHRLYFTAAIERRRWELDNHVVAAAMREQATHKLHQEKEAKVRTKAITEADIESMMGALFPDEYRENRLTAEKIERTEKSMANLAELWISRCRSLNAMLSKSR